MLLHNLGQHTSANYSSFNYTSLVHIPLLCICRLRVSTKGCYELRGCYE